jgi:uncharacterized cofD-like protein
VAVLGGGNGILTVLRGLADLARDGRSLEITAIVATADDGGSSGCLRRERGGLPPGDLRNCLWRSPKMDAACSRGCSRIATREAGISPDIPSAT